MRWLITGGCGFVGTNLAHALLRRGEDVVIVDNLSRTGSRDNLAWLRQQHGRDWRFVEIDIRDTDEVERLVGELRPAVLAHLAAQVAMIASLGTPRLDFEVNALGTLNVLEAVRLYSPQTAVLYASTNKIYGDLEWVRYEEHETRYVAPDFPNGFDESIPLDFRTPYGCSKGTADQYVLDFARMYGLRTVVFRHSSMYGGRQFATHDQGWIGWFCMKAVEARRAQDAGLRVPTVTISGNGKQVRDVLHAEDVVALYFTAATQIEKVSGRAFNIGGGADNSLSLIELLQLLGERLDVSLAYESGHPRKSDQRVFIADTSLAERLLLWFPKISVSQGIAWALEWAQGGRTEEA